MIPFLDMKAVYAELKPELDAAFTRVMESGWYVLGKEVEAFEAEYAAFCGTKHCIGLGNGLEALEFALRGWDIGPGDEVIVPSNTYIATWLAVTAVGATVVPVEPTPSMVFAGRDAVWRSGGAGGDSELGGDAIAAYRAMLAARPLEAKNKPEGERRHVS